MKSQLPSLKAELAALNKLIEQARISEAPAAIAVCRELIDMFGLTAHDLGLDRTQAMPTPTRVSRTIKPGAPRPVSAPFYRNQETGETWNGRGRPPGWMKKRPPQYGKYNVHAL